MSRRTFAATLALSLLLVVPGVAAQKPTRTPATPAPVAAQPADAWQRALQSLRQGRISEAHSLLRERLQSVPEDLAARRVLARLLIDSGQTAEAAQLLAEGQRLAPQELDLAQSLARLQADRGEPLAALKALELSAAHATQDADYLAFMAVLYGQTHQPERAVALWQQALRLSPENSKWWLALGAVQQARGDHTGARLSYLEALKGVQLDAAGQARARRGLRQTEALAVD